MLEVGRFVIHVSKRYEREPEPSLPLCGYIVKDNGLSWSIEWVDGSQTYEDKDAVMEA